MNDTAITYTAVELLDKANTGITDSPLTARTLRYYTSLKLIDAPVSRPGQPGRYTDKHLIQLAAVRSRQAAGRGLAEIAAEFAANPDASTTVTQRPVRVVPEGMPAGLPMPDAAVPHTTSQCWPTTTTPCQPNGGIYPWEQRRIPTPVNARTITVAPGVQIVLTGSALYDTALIARIVAAANHYPYTHPTTIWNGTTS